MSNSDTEKSPIDYLAIGHVTHDVVATGYQAGGTVIFAGRLAQALGLRVGVITSAAPEYDFAAALPDIDVINVPAAQSTTFENIYTASGRRQTVHSVAAMLTGDHFPETWQRTPVIHLAPVAGEIGASTLDACNGAFVGLTPQGLMRFWHADGRVTPCALRNAETILPRVNAAVVSEEDLVNNAELRRICAMTQLVVLTEGARGCTVFQNGTATHVSAPSVTEVNPIGAGDIFAAAFFVRMSQNGQQAIDSAEFAVQIAALSVTQPTPETKTEAISRFVTSKTLQFN